MKRMSPQGDCSSEEIDPNIDKMIAQRERYAAARCFNKLC